MEPALQRYIQNTFIGGFDKGKSLLDPFNADIVPHRKTHTLFENRRKIALAVGYFLC
jgi:hypothetical protein